MSLQARRAGAARVARRYRREMRHYWRDARTPRDFGDIMRVRLSLSKVGRIACRRPLQVRVSTRSLGHGVVLRSHSTDISVLKELTLSGSYAMLDEHLRTPPATILDLGANTGLAARWLHGRHPDARLICVEPEPGNLAILQSNLAGVPRAEIVPACVGARAREVTLASRSGAWGFRMEDADRDADGRVPVVTVDSLIRDHGIERIDVLKCDIEGAEQELFAACAGWIDRVDLAVVELHDGMRAESLTAAIAANGAHAEVLDVLGNPAYGTEVVTFRVRPAS